MPSWLHVSLFFTIANVYGRCLLITGTSFAVYEDYSASNKGLAKKVQAQLQSAYLVGMRSIE